MYGRRGKFRPSRLKGSVVGPPTFDREVRHLCECLPWSGSFKATMDLWKRPLCISERCCAGTWRLEADGTSAPSPHVKALPNSKDEQANMLQKRAVIEGKPWSVDAVKGGRDLFNIMCIDASAYTRDGNMHLGCRQSACRVLAELFASLSLATPQAMGAKRWLRPD